MCAGGDSDDSFPSGLVVDECSWWCVAAVDSCDSFSNTLQLVLSAYKDYSSVVVNGSSLGGRSRKASEYPNRIDGMFARLLPGTLLLKIHVLLLSGFVEATTVLSTLLLFFFVIFFVSEIVPPHPLRTWRRFRSTISVLFIGGTISFYLHLSFFAFARMSK